MRVWRIDRPESNIASFDIYAATDHKATLPRVTSYRNWRSAITVPIYVDSDTICKGVGLGGRRAGVALGGRTAIPD